MTPEGKVKAAVKKCLAKQGEDCEFFMPVQTGYGARDLDFIGGCRGHSFGIETKAPKKTPTPLQGVTIRRKDRAGTKVFVIDSVDSPVLQELDSWLSSREWTTTHDHTCQSKA